jgi:foldase protein PrsA
MKSIRIILALGAFFVLGAVVIAGCGSGVSGDAIADVSGNPITKRAFAHWVFIAAKGQAAQSPGAPVIIPDPPEFKKCISTAKAAIPQLAKTPDKTIKKDCGDLFTSLRDEVMGFLIKSYWYQAEAHRQHISINNADIQKALADAKKQQGFTSDTQFQSFLKSSGQTLDDILYRVRVNQLFKKLTAKAGVGTATDAQVQAYYNTHGSQFGTPETRNIRIILTKTKAQAAAALAALNGGATWKATAAKYSTDPSTKSKGGQLIGVTQGQQDAALDRAAFAAPAQKLLGPIQGQFGFYVFKVTGTKKGTKQTLAQATPLIKQILQGQQQTSGQATVEKNALKRYQSRTKCRSGFVMVDCAGYKAPKTSTATTGAQTGPPPTTSTTPATTTGK